MTVNEKSSLALKYSLIFILVVAGLSVGIYFLASGILSRYYHSNKPRDEQKILLISLDGFRHDLRNKADTPNLDKFVENGVSAEHLINVFPTSTLTNHQSAVTGLYADHHGMIGNIMYDRQTRAVFTIDNTQSKWWEGGTPIWIDNQEQGHDSGVCFWPGYDVLFHGEKASYIPNDAYTHPFADTKNIMPFDMRVNLAIDWLKKDNLTFVALYIDEPDRTEHEIGPDPSSDVLKDKLRAKIENVDTIIGMLMERIEKEGLAEKVNVIIEGDHGQVSQSRNKVIYLNKYVDFTKYAEIIIGTTSMFIFSKPVDGYIDEIYKPLKAAENHFKVYLKKDIPLSFHIRDNERTGDILVLADPGWTLLHKNKTLSEVRIGGTHGYSNLVKDMHPIFYAQGPLIRKNYQQDVIYMVDLYSLMCSILQIKPKKNDGNFERIKTILNEYS